MFNLILRASIRHRYLVLCISCIIAILGAVSYRNLIIDAVPDITNVQVQVNSEAMGYSPFEVEQRVTAPIERMLSGIPGMDHTRSISRYGLSQVTVIFHDDVDIYFARQLISQKLQESKDLLPSGINPSMGPIATGLGEIYMYTIENQTNSKSIKSLQELRELQDWIVKPQLRTIQGVVEINSIGGAEKQIVISPNSEKLRAFDLSFDDISIAVASNNSNVGAGYVENNGEQFLLRVPSQLTDYRELNDIVIGIHDGKPIYLRDIAKIEIGSELRNGAATENGREVVLGTVFMLMGENGRDVSNRVTSRIDEIKKSLPEGVDIKPVYKRSTLVENTIKTVRTNLFEGAVLVMVVLFLSLGNFRAALITAGVIPISMLITIFCMVQGKLSANLMSLGALDFGLIVDGAVILVENCMKRFGEEQARLKRQLTKEERLELVFDASSEVRQATMFGELIIMVVYIPILTLGGIEGKMYQPMALTVLLALGAAFILSLTFVPAAVAIFISKPVEHLKLNENRFKAAYRRVLGQLLMSRTILFTCAIIFFLSSLFLFPRLGTEFIPSLDEGDIALHALRIPGTSLTQSIEMQYIIEEKVKAISEVSNVFGKIGTAEVANDPMPPSVADGFVILKPRVEWDNPKRSKSSIVAELEEIVQAIPGNNYEFTQPIQMRFNELIAGVRSDLAVKLFGDDMDVLLEKGREIEKILSAVPGSSDVKLEQVTGLPFISVELNKQKLARFGLNASHVQELFRSAYAGLEISKYYNGDRNFPIVLRLDDETRNNIDRISQLSIPLPFKAKENEHTINTSRSDLQSKNVQKSYILLGDVAEVVSSQGPNQISRENGKRRIVVTVNVRNRDLGSFVEEAQSAVNQQFKIPENYWIGWDGQYKNLISAKNRLLFVVPLVLIGVFGLIFLTFRSTIYSLLIFTGIPFALSGGIYALWLRNIPFSISAAVGFIALSGVSVLNGLVLVSFTKSLIDEGLKIENAVIEGAISRLRPVLMTAAVASLGFIPMAFSQGTGSEVQRPLATVVIGGIISSTFLTLLVLPILISIFSKKEVK